LRVDEGLEIIGTVAYFGLCAGASGTRRVEGGQSSEGFCRAMSCAARCLVLAVSSAVLVRPCPGARPGMACKLHAHEQRVLRGLDYINAQLWLE
jgi:hypothetical protein